MAQWPPTQREVGAPRAGRPFELVSPHSPTGHQPGAIAGLLKGLSEDVRHQTLLGITGSGKTFTIANVVAQVNRPTLVLAPNKTLAEVQREGVVFLGWMQSRQPHALHTRSPMRRQHQVTHTSTGCPILQSGAQSPTMDGPGGTP